MLFLFLYWSYTRYMLMPGYAERISPSIIVKLTDHFSTTNLHTKVFHTYTRMRYPTPGSVKR